MFNIELENEIQTTRLVAIALKYTNGFAASELQSAFAGLEFSETYQVRFCNNWKEFAGYVTLNDDEFSNRWKGTSATVETGTLLFSEEEFEFGLNFVYRTFGDTDYINPYRKHILPRFDTLSRYIVLVKIKVCGDFINKKYNIIVLYAPEN